MAKEKKETKEVGAPAEAAATPAAPSAPAAESATPAPTATAEGAPATETASKPEATSKPEGGAAPAAPKGEVAEISAKGKKKKPGVPPRRGKKLRNHLRNVERKLRDAGLISLKQAVAELKKLK